MTSYMTQWPGWMRDASCAQIGAHADHDLWFPRSGELGGDPGWEAKRVCFRCPVRGECLDYAVINHLDYGIFGGVGGRRRTQMRAEMRAGTRRRAA